VTTLLAPVNEINIPGIERHVTVPAVRSTASDRRQGVGSCLGLPRADAARLLLEIPGRPTFDTLGLFRTDARLSFLSRSSIFGAFSWQVPLLGPSSVQDR
jgi:hypothetical protein